MHLELRPSDRDPTTPGRLADRSIDQEHPLRDRIRCRACGAVVTDECHRTSVGGSHVHRRRNPFDIEFEFGCFARADGVTVHGQPTLEHSWFPAHAWSLAMCGGCANHLGWCFEGSSPVQFYGLILDQLVIDADSFE